MEERVTVQGMRSDEEVERLFVEDDVAEVLWARRLGRYGFAVEELAGGRYRARAATWNVLIGREEAVDYRC